jgi:hypothetical protein
MMAGTAYVFCRYAGAPVGPFKMGHVGWAFTGSPKADGVFGYCGSTEELSGSPWAKAREANFWMRACASEAEIMHWMRNNPEGAPPYDAYKTIAVAKPDADAAWKQVLAAQSAGYLALGKNCLDFTYRVLNAYGADKLPWPSTHPAPNSFFNDVAGKALAVPAGAARSDKGSPAAPDLSGGASVSSCPPSLQNGLFLPVSAGDVMKRSI